VSDTGLVGHERLSSRSNRNDPDLTDNSSDEDSAWKSRERRSVQVSRSSKAEDTRRSLSQRGQPNVRRANSKLSGGRKGVSSRGTTYIQPFNRSDAARLRQDNIELRAQVARLQAALDRARLENSRVKEDLQKAQMESQKQKSVIAFLKEEKLYGNK
jgi:lipid II:glycine glycyltransferase (peptidoglycan interpeptide bridge formation enzyme)